MELMTEEKKGFKRTDVGLIPEDWEIKPLGNVLTVKHGKSQKAVESEDGKNPILGTGGVIGRTNSYLYDKPSVLIGRKGTIDNPKYIETPFWTVDTLFYTIIEQGYLAKYIYYYFNLIDWYSYNEASGVPSLNSSTIEGIRIPLPPTLTEQQAIASALSDVDELIRSLDGLIQKKQAIKKGAMQQLLSGKKRLPGFDGEWEVKKIGEIASIKTGAKNTEDKVEDGKYPFFVRSSKEERINTYSFDGQAVLTAGDGVGTGKIFHYINGKFDYHQRVYKMSDFPSDVDGYYFYLYFSTHFYNRVMAMTAKSSVDSVRTDMIADMDIHLPPIKEQKTIAQILSDMDRELQNLRQKREKVVQIKQGMMQELLTGRTRLIQD